MERLYVTDLDGTLLNHEIALSDFTTRTLNELLDRGLPLTYATSRSYYTTQKLLKDLHFCLPCVTFNGVYVIDAATGETLRKNLLSPEIFDFIGHKARALNLQPFVFGKIGDVEKLLYLPPHNPAQQHFIGERQSRQDRRLQEDDGNTQLDEIITVTFLYPEDALRPLQDAIGEAFGDQVSIKCIRDIYNPGYFSLEISNPHANKGDMLLYVCKLLGVEPAALTVFGDQANDIEMFRIAGNRIAVQNTAPELIALSDLVIEDNNSDGVAKYLLSQFNK